MNPKSLKNFNVFIDGIGYAGRVTEGAPPKITVKTEEHIAGGMAAPVDVDAGTVEKLTFEVTLAEYNPAVHKLLGKDDVAVVFRAAQGVNDVEAEAVIVSVRALMRELDPGSLKAAAGKTELKLAFTASYYKLDIADETVVEIDAVNMKRVIGGVDQLASQRRALGLTF